MDVASLLCPQVGACATHAWHWHAPDQRRRGWSVRQLRRKDQRLHRRQLRRWCCGRHTCGSFHGHRPLLPEKQSHSWRWRAALKLQKPGDAEISSVTSVPGRLPTQAVPDLFSSTDHHTIADSPGQSMSMDHHEKVTTAIWSVEGANQCTPEHTHRPHASHTLPTAPCTPLDTSVSPVYSSVLKACPY